MFIYLLAPLLQAGAFPIISTGAETVPTVAHTLLWGIEPRAQACSDTLQRSLYQIIRSCVLTIIVCVYRAIHQNVPDPDAGWWKRQGIKAGIAIIAVFAPEAVLWWAVRQWFGARTIRDQVNKIQPDLRWTSTHGYFAQMGGFGIVEEQYERILYPPTLIKLLKENRLDLAQVRRITKKQINDRSKGDALSKGILLLQTTWFIFECLARFHQKLFVTKLEVATLAFAVLNIITYFLWWSKPLDVLCPIYFDLLPAQEEEEDAAPSDSPENTKPRRPFFELVLEFVSKIVTLPFSFELGFDDWEDSDTGKVESQDASSPTQTHDPELGPPAQDAPAPIVPDNQEPPQSSDAIPDASLTVPVNQDVPPNTDTTPDTPSTPTDNRDPIPRRNFKILKWIIRFFQAVGIVLGGLLYLGLIAVDLALGLALGAILVVLGLFVFMLKELFTNDEVHENATSVGTFYAMEMSEGTHRIAWAFSCSAGVAFGAIHFISWNYGFENHAQLILWRVSCVVMVVMPFWIGLVQFVYLVKEGNWGSSLDSYVSPGTWIQAKIPKTFRVVFRVFWVIFGVFWVIFRVIWMIILMVFILGGIVALGGSTLLYIISRFCVIVLAFRNLHDLPPETFENVSWTQYISHL